MNYLKKLVLLYKKCRCYCNDTLNVLYDSQDNIVKINGGNWEQSWNLDTMEGLNPKIAVRHLWNTNQIRISSSEYFQITEIIVNGEVCPVTQVSGDWYCTYDDMHDFMDNSDVFNLKIKARKRCVRMI